MKALGIDIRHSRPRRWGHFCLLGGVEAALYGVLSEPGDAEGLLRRYEPDAVAVGAPLTLGRGGKIITRPAERLLRRLQHPLCWNPRFAPMPSPMIPSLAGRGAALGRELRSAASTVPVLETHPASTWEFLDLPGGPDRFAAAARDSSILRPFGIGADCVAAATSPLLLDALLTALTARLFLDGKTVSFGGDGDGRICLPRPAKVEFVAMDVDGTLTDVESPWRRVHERLNLWHGNADAFLLQWLDGEISYDRFCALDVGLWNSTGTSLEKVHRLLDEIPVRPQAIGLLRMLVQRGVAVAMVSAGFRWIAARVARIAGVAGKVKIIANELRRTSGGKIQVRVHVSGDEGSSRSKGRHLRRLFSSFGVSPVKALAVGDGPLDAGIFERCGQRLVVATADDLNRVVSICDG